MFKLGDREHLNHCQYKLGLSISFFPAKIIKSRAVWQNKKGNVSACLDLNTEKPGFGEIFLLTNTFITKIVNNLARFDYFQQRFRF